MYNLSMNGVKQHAIQLRKKGKSYQEISISLGVAKSTLSNWFRQAKWSVDIYKKLEKEARAKARQRMTQMSHEARRQRIQMYEGKRLLARKEYKTYKKELLFMSALAIYWGEGDKSLKNGNIRVSNSDPQMLRIIRLFFEKYFPELRQKIRAYLILYPDLDEQNCLRYWSTEVGLPEKLFYKSSYIQGKSEKRTLTYGVGTIIITNRAHKEKVVAWVEEFRNESFNAGVAQW